MDTNCIVRSLEFHGQPLQKIWEDECGAEIFKEHAINPKELDFAVYRERQKQFVFQERAKRLKLHQFIARKASELYDTTITRPLKSADDAERAKRVKLYTATLPAYEVFVKQNDRVKYMRCILEAISPGDIVYGMITKLNSIYSTTPLIIKPLCTAEPLVRFLADIPIKAYVQVNNSRSPPSETRTKQHAYAVNNFICCEVLEISVDADRISLSLEKVLSKNNDIKLGLVSASELPLYYRISKELQGFSYENCFNISKETRNPNYDILFEMNELHINDNYSMMNYFKQVFPPQNYAKQLRSTQISSWAFKLVIDGVERFRNGNALAAFQCLNQALSYDPTNIEGLVARGALYANRGSFLKALEDFDAALKLNPEHANARNYMGETLVAQGRKYEEEGNMEDAVKLYTQCLHLYPEHEQANLSLRAIQMGTSTFDLKKAIKAGAVYPMITDNQVSKPLDPPLFKSFDANDSAKDVLVHSSGKHLAMQKDDEYDNNVSNFKESLSKSERDQNRAFLKHEEKAEDDTQKRVRKLLQEASKHKKEKSKRYKRSRDRGNEFDSNSHDIHTEQSESYIERKLSMGLQMYENSTAAIKRRQEALMKTTAFSNRHSESPIPEPPSMTIYDRTKPSNSLGRDKNEEKQKLSFQIRKPVKIDKFGLVRIATPLTQRSSNTSRSSTRSGSREQFERRHDEVNSRSRSRTRCRFATSSRSRSRYRSSRSSSVETRRRRRRRSSPRNSITRSPSFNSYRRSYRSRQSFIKKRYHNYRRTPSPFQPRGTPSPRRRRSRSRYSSNERDTRNPQRKNFGNRVWRRARRDESASDEKFVKKPRDWDDDKHVDDNEAGTSTGRSKRKF